MKEIITLIAFFLSVCTIHAQDPHILWQKTIGGSDSDLLWSLIATNDGGFLASGYSTSNISGEKNENSRGESDYWVLKLDENGTIQWQRTLGGNDEEFLSTAIQTSDGGYMLGGVSKSDISGDKTENSRGNNDFWVLKLDSSGNIIWQKTIGGSEADVLASLVETDDGGYLLTGDSRSSISGDRTVEQSGPFGDVWVVKLDSEGTIDWQKAYHVTILHKVAGLAKTNDGGFIISSEIKIDNWNDDFWILKLDASGNQIWDKTIEGNNFDWAPKITTTADGDFIVAGISNSDAFGDKSENSINGSFDYWVLKLDETGNIIWENTIGGDSNEGNIYLVSESADGGYLVSGFSDSNISGDKTENSNGGSDFWFVKLNEVGIIEWQNTIGGAGNELGGRSISTSDGNYLTAGYSSSNISGDKTENSRGGLDYWILKHDSTLGVQENTFANVISIYPNPVKNTLHINSQDKTIDQINIYSVTGSRIMHLDLDSISPNVDVSSLASAVYFVQLYSGNNVALKKFVKE